MNNYYCFNCGQMFWSNVAPDRHFTNAYGKWDGTDCPDCAGNAKLIGQQCTTYMPEEIFFNDGKNRKITKAHLEDIRSRAVTPDGTVLRGKEGLKYNYSKGMKAGGRLDHING